MHNYFLTVLPPLAFRGGRNGGKTRASRATIGSCFNVKLSVVIKWEILGASVKLYERLY